MGMPASRRFWLARVLRICGRRNNELDYTDLIEIPLSILKSGGDSAGIVTCGAFI